jgi:hypothetical protein
MFQPKFRNIKLGRFYVNPRHIRKVTFALEEDAWSKEHEVPAPYLLIDMCGHDIIELYGADAIVGAKSLGIHE